MPGESTTITASLSVDELCRIEEACSRFEADWRANAAARPRIEDYLEGVPDAERRTLVEYLLRLEAELTAIRPNRDGLIARFPAHRALIESLPFGDGDRYVLLEEIGRGGMGVVYRAIQSGVAGKVVAVKMIHPTRLDSREAIHRFISEAQAQAGLHHAHIVPILDSGELGGQPYFVMEYISGPTLSARLKEEGPFRPHEAAEVIRALAGALDYLHRTGRIHCDLKPANILIAEDGRSLLGDFGLVKVLEVSRRPGSHRVIEGTAPYMAPEQAEGLVEAIGKAVDVYGLGAILYELLTGRPPFQGTTDLEILDKVLRSEPPAPRSLRPGLPRELELICLTCLAKAPEDRYCSAAALSQDLLQFLKGEPLIHAQEPGPWQRVRRWARRKPALAIRLGVIAACLAVIWTEGPLHQAGLSLIPRGFEGHFLPSSNPFSPYWRNTTLLLLWAAACWGFQGIADRVVRVRGVQPSWLLADVVVLTLLLANIEALSTPLVVAYPVLVAVSGLWLNVRTVVLTTVFAIAGYLTLLLPEILAGPVPMYLHLHFVTAMVTIGLITVYQVRRMQALGRLYVPQRPAG